MVCLEVMLTAAATILPPANLDTVRAGILNQLGCTQPACSLPDLPPFGTYLTSMLSSRLAPSWDILNQYALFQICPHLGHTQPVCSLLDLPPVGTYSTGMLSSRLAPSWDGHRPCTAALTGEGCRGPDEDLSVASGAGSVPPPPQVLRSGAGSHAQQVSTWVMKLCLCLFVVCVCTAAKYTRL